MSNAEKLANAIITLEMATENVALMEKRGWATDADYEELRWLELEVERLKRLA